VIEQLIWLLKITGSQVIARRYFIVNGFDGALTMLGLLVGFYVSEDVSLAVVSNACLGVAIALGMSGVSSAYISEAAEKQRELRRLTDRPHASSPCLSRSSMAWPHCPSHW
jgi:predicted membrane protein (TIGR00267 family)